MHMPTLKRQWTADDLRDLPDDGNRYEVIDGELFVTPAPSWEHQRAAAELFRLVAAYLERQPYADVLIAPADVVVFADSKCATRPVRCAARQWPTSKQVRGRWALATRRRDSLTDHSAG